MKIKTKKEIENIKLKKEQQQQENNIIMQNIRLELILNRPRLSQIYEKDKFKK